MLAIVSIGVVLAVWRFAVVFGAVVFEGVGLSRSAAGFESRSALVGAGYTTSQSEAVVDNPVTRRVAAMLIVFGYFGPPTLIALLGATFVVPTDDDLGDRFLLLIVMLAALFLLDRAHFFQWVGARPARRLARRMLGRTAVDTWVAIGDRIVAEVVVPADEPRASDTIAALANDEIRTLAVDDGTPGGTTYPDDGRPAGAGPGDRIVVFGPRQILNPLRSMS